MPVVGDLEQIEACIADKRDSKFANQFDRGGSVNEIEHVIRSRLVHSARAWECVHESHSVFVKIRIYTLGWPTRVYLSRR